MPQSVSKALAVHQRDLNSDSQNPDKKPGAVAHAYKPSTGNLERGGHEAPWIAHLAKLTSFGFRK